MRRAVSFAALLCALLAAGPAPSQPLEDPRLEEASALLGDASGFPRAIELYRALLAEHPDAVEVRLLLARVLSWSERYDEALAEYDALLAADEPPASARIERAEVLSWAGRYDEAEASFRAALADDPGDARAARGLARVLAWSGRTREADAAYERALELEDDTEARGEWSALRAGHPPGLRSRSEYFSDNDGFRRLTSTLEAFAFLDLDTRLMLRTQALRLRGDAPASDPDLAERDWGAELAAGAQRRFGERLEGELELGARVWSHAPAHPLARARLTWTARADTVAVLRLHHSDFLDGSDSLAALEDGVHDTTAAISLWKGLGPRFEYWGELKGSLLGDSNQRLSVESSLSWRPWSERELRLQLSGGLLQFSGSSDLYYDPAPDVSARLGLTHRVELPWRVRFDLNAGAGFGYAKQDGVVGSGPAFDASASLSRAVGRWRLAIGGGHQQSRRRTVYRADRVTASVGLDF